MAHARDLVCVLVLGCGWTGAATATEYPPNNDGILRINYCGTFSRQWFLDYRDPQFGDTLTDQLVRAADAKCRDLELLSVFSFPPGHAYAGADGFGLFSDGHNHNDPYSTGSFDGYCDDPPHLLYTLTHVRFACIESVEGTLATVAESVSCPPFSDAVPGGNSSLPATPGDLDFILQTSSAFAKIPHAGGPVTSGGVLSVAAVSFLDLGNKTPGDPGIFSFELAAEKAEVALHQDPWNTQYLQLAATALLRTAQRNGEGVFGETAEQAEKRWLIAESVTAGSAAYDLACLAALRNDPRSARRWYDLATSTGNLPPVAHILADEDLINVRNQPWFPRRTSAR